MGRVERGVTVVGGNAGGGCRIAEGSGELAGVDEVMVFRERIQESFDGVRGRAVDSAVADRAEGRGDEGVFPMPRSLS